MTNDFVPIPTDKVWQRFEVIQDTICKAYLEGKTVHEIAQLHNLPLKQVKLVVSRAALKEQAEGIRKDIMVETMKTKVPLLREVVSLSLLTLRDFLQTLQTDEARKERLTVKDAKDLSAIAKEINDIARLELGQSTQNIEVVSRVEKDINVIIDELKQKDPFANYENDPDPSVDTEPLPPSSD